MTKDETDIDLPKPEVNGTLIVDGIGAGAAYQRALAAIHEETGLEPLDLAVTRQDGAWAFRAIAVEGLDGSLRVLCRAKGWKALTSEAEGWVRGYREGRERAALGESHAGASRERTENSPPPERS